MSMLAAVAAPMILMLACGPALPDGAFVRSEHSGRARAEDITEPRQKALIIHSDGVEQLVLQVSYKGSASEFAWVIPTPSPPTVFPVDAPVFHRLSAFTGGGIAYWFKPGWIPLTLGGGNAARRAAGPKSRLDVKVLNEDVVGVYDVTVLRSGDARDLFEWLKERKYQVPEALVPLAADYIRRGWVFTAVRVSADRQAASERKLNEGTLQSLSFVFRAPEPVYPLKISSLNSGKTEVLLYVLAPLWVSDPQMTAVCRLTFHFRDWDRLPVGQALFWESLRSHSYSMPVQLTKLRAEFTPEQMSRDILLSSDNALAQMRPKPRPASLAENAGAVSLYAMMIVLLFALVYPFNLLVILGANLAAVSRSGSSSARRWLSFSIWYTVLMALAYMLFYPVLS